MAAVAGCVNGTWSWHLIIGSCANGRAGKEIVSFTSSFITLHNLIYRMKGTHYQMPGKLSEGDIPTNKKHTKVQELLRLKAIKSNLLNLLHVFGKPPYYLSISLRVQEKVEVSGVRLFCTVLQQHLQSTSSQVPQPTSKSKQLYCSSRGGAKRNSR